MPAKPDSPQLLRDEILAEARQQSEKILQEAQQQSELQLTKARHNADEIRQNVMRQAQAEANRRAELVLATLPVEAGRLRSARLEALLESIVQQARQHLLSHEGFDYRKAIITLAAEALSKMAGERFIMLFASADRAAFGDGIGQEIRQLLGRATLDLTVAVDPTLEAGGGIVIRDVSGRLVWDNRPISRLQRLWPELRRQVASRLELLNLNRSEVRGDC